MVALPVGFYCICSVYSMYLSVYPDEAAAVGGRKHHHLMCLKRAFPFVVVFWGV